jgi:hypothetical protein
MFLSLVICYVILIHLQKNTSRLETLKHISLQSPTSEKKNMHYS